ncbi:MAG: hypothetical protein ABIJ16_02255, partial [Bacteroidota bacterium]
MSKLLFLILSVLFSLSYLMAQNQDSLLKVWNDSSEPDSARLNAINDLAWTFIYHDPDTAFAIASEGLSYANEKKDIYWQSKLINTQGTSYYVKGDLNIALDYFLARLELIEKLGDKTSLASAYNNIGV